MSAFLENIIFGKNTIGIEIFSIDNRDTYALIETSKKKNEIVISKNQVFDSLETLLQEKTKIPVALTINNRQVLQKQVEGTDANDKKLLHKAFPNINLNDFHYEIIRFKYNSVIAVCRKSYIEELLLSLSDFRIFSISLGINPIATIASLDIPDVLFTNNQSVSLEGEFNQGASSEVEYNINGLSVLNKYLIAFCSALTLILKSTGSNGTIAEVNDKIENDNKQKVIFEKGIKIGLIAVLGILVLNFFVFSYYFDKSNNAKETITLNQVNIDNIVKARERIKGKEQKVNDLTSQSLSKSSLNINEISKIVPSSILLTTIDYLPVEKKIKDNEAIQFINNTILITGTTIDNEAFTSWVSQIEQYNWVDKVTILSFGKNRENKTEFELRIETE
ncbi:hypothetical protein [Flavobacterium beibuense]|uniref:hypothetical protein n=1 Tax=Flavobacterium beibuense TaxID=657326 RepID=UPI003A909C2A